MSFGKNEENQMTKKLEYGLFMPYSSFITFINCQRWDYIT